MKSSLNYLILLLFMTIPRLLYSHQSADRQHESYDDFKTNSLIFDYFQTKESEKCFGIVNRYPNISKKQLIDLINNCDSIYISFILIEINSSILKENYKDNFNFTINDIKTDLSRLNTALVDINFVLRSKKIDSNLYEQLWKNNGLYFYLAFLLSNKSHIIPNNLRSFLVEKLKETNCSIREEFIDSNELSLFVYLKSKISESTNIDQYMKKYYVFASNEKLRNFIDIELNSDKFRLNLYRKISKNLEKAQNSSNFYYVKSFSNYFNKLVLLSYLGKDEEMIKSLNNPENAVFFSKESSFLISKFLNSEFNHDPFIFYKKNEHLIYFDSKTFLPTNCISRHSILNK